LFYIAKDEFNTLSIQWKYLTREPEKPYQIIYVSIEIIPKY